MKQTGIELIAQERKEQIGKHGISVEEDARMNAKGELAQAANTLTDYLIDSYEDRLLCNPWPWNNGAWKKICSKPYKERLVVAGALIAAEIDRLQATE